MTPEFHLPLIVSDLPQSGWTTERPWCKALGLQKNEFLKLLMRFGIPHVEFGTSVLIDSGRFYQTMSIYLDKPQAVRGEIRDWTASQSAGIGPESSSNQAAFEILRKKQVAELLKCSERQVENLVRQGVLPKPVYFGNSSPRWKRSDIEAVFDRARSSKSSKD